MIEKILINNLPSLDLHGIDREIACILANDFILENYKLKKPRVVIIHGKGEGILKKSIHQLLKSNKYVRSFELHLFNTGITIVEIKSE